MAFTVLVETFKQIFKESIKQQLSNHSIRPFGTRCSKLEDYLLLRRTLVSHQIISSRNIFTRIAYFQRRKQPPNQLRPHLNKFSAQPASTRTIVIAGLGVFAFGYYITHLEESPITKRKRFMVFDNQSVAKLSSKVNQDMLISYEPFMLAPGHPKFRTVSDVVNSLLTANEDVVYISKIPWKLTVVDKPMVNAFVLVDGHIVVFTGMIDLCQNTDQLAAVLGHELSHVILEHIPEKISNAHLLSIVMMIPLLVIFSIFPLAKALLVESLLTHLAQLAITLPFSRKLESEADEVGMILAARACFDVREASKLWERMAKKSKGEPPAFLSTHPSHESRKEKLKALAGPAMRMRRAYGCPPLN